MNQDDFKHLRELANKRPKRKARLIQLLWPEIRQALNAGHTVREIGLALKKDGIEINYSNLRYYVACLRREDIAETPEKPIRSAGVQTDSRSVSPDAGSAIKAQRAKRVKFDHDPFSTRIKDLV